jgi:thiol-disulfide isomerase/thioredoxin
MVLIGAGLIVIGLVAFQFLTPDTITNEYSVIPQAVNFPAPELTLNNLNGEPISISDYTEHIVLINNWATWCPPCRAEMPTLARYYKEHKNEQFMLIGIEAGDPANEVASFVNDNKITFPILLDPGNKALIAFRNDGLPSSYVLDRSGTVVLAWTGPISKDMLEKYVTPLLEQ